MADDASDDTPAYSTLFQSLWTIIGQIVLIQLESSCCLIGIAEGPENGSSKEVYND